MTQSQYVTFNGTNVYPARIDPATTYTGPQALLNTVPRFDWETVCRMAIDTRTAAARHGYGYDCVDILQVIPAERVWEDQDPDQVAIFRATFGKREVPWDCTYVVPDDDGLYGIGGGQWTWRLVADPTPTADTLGNAKSAALDARRAANLRLGRVAAVATAAAWRDLRPDAVHAELAQSVGGVMWSTGRYWTADGQERTVDLTKVYAMSEWVSLLDDDTEHAWRSLTTKLPDGPSAAPYWNSYRFDLIAAADLSIG